MIEKALLYLFIFYLPGNLLLFFTLVPDFISVEEFFVDSVPGPSSPPLDEKNS